MVEFECRHPLDSRWRNPRRCTPAWLPHRVRKWLLDERSLTQRLIVASEGKFRVHVLRKNWSLAPVTTRGVLDMGARQMVLQREVTLNCAGRPCVFARSILPATTLIGALTHLRKYGDDSLGELLFRKPGVIRDRFDVALLGPGSSNVPLALQCAQPLWARRSRFWFRGRPLLVMETFLPDHPLSDL